MAASPVSPSDYIHWFAFTNRSSPATGMCLGGHLVSPIPSENIAILTSLPPRRSAYVSLSHQHNLLRSPRASGLIPSPHPRLLLLLRDRHPLCHARQGQERRLAHPRKAWRLQRQRASGTSPSKPSSLTLSNAPANRWSSANRYAPLKRRRRATVTGIEIIQDTHVPRAGRDLIRSTLEDANVAVTVRLAHSFSRVLTQS